MLDRLRAMLPKDLIESELAELREHKFRAGFMGLILLALLIFLIADERTIVKPPKSVAVDIEPQSESQAAPPVDPIRERRTEIIGLARAAEDTQLLNPFAVDLPRSEPEPLVVPLHAAPPPLSTPPINRQPAVTPQPSDAFESSDPIEPPGPPMPRLQFTLKGTAISDNKKLAVVSCEVLSSEKSDETPRGAVEQRMLSIGEDLNGRKVVEIGKNFVEFDDGRRLELPKVQP